MDTHLNDHGFLEVDNGHKLYWEDWGNPQGVPVISLHGGPGSGFKDSHKALFNPEKHHVLFFDQRGAGRSTPFASTEHNTTRDLIDDIEKLREMMSFTTAYIAGGSWGSTLSLLYAIAHPEKVKGLLVWSIYLARQFENDWVNSGSLRDHFPAEWERFISLVPQEHRTSGDAIMAYYATQIRASDEITAHKHAIEWSLWESALLSIQYDPAANEAEVTNDAATTAVAVLETHYFINHCFVAENYILDNLHKISHLPCFVVHGRFDMCTPPVSAYDLANSYGGNATLRWVNSGHLRSDPAMLEALQFVADQNLI